MPMPNLLRQSQITTLGSHSNNCFITMISVYPCKWIERVFGFFYCKLDFQFSIFYGMQTRMIRILLFYLTQDDTSSSFTVTVTALICMITAFIGFHESSLQLSDALLCFMNAFN
jgi:uncharacterized membrane protein YGL010W